MQLALPSQKTALKKWEKKWGDGANVAKKNHTHQKESIKKWLNCNVIAT